MHLKLLWKRAQDRDVALAIELFAEVIRQDPNLTGKLNSPDIHDMTNIENSMPLC